MLEAINGRYMSHLRSDGTSTNRHPIAYTQRIPPVREDNYLVVEHNITNIEGMEYQLEEPINAIFSEVEDLEDLAELVGRPFTPKQIDSIGYLIVLKHIIFRPGIRKWLRHAAVGQA